MGVAGMLRNARPESARNQWPNWSGKRICDGTGFEIVMIRFRSGPFNFVRSVKYYLDDKGDRWPRWLREINWPSNKMIRRTLKPFFFFIDRVCFGDVLQATLRKIPHSAEAP